MLSSPFTYEKAKVIQALRFHFISRREIKIMIILINVFAITSAILFYVKKIDPLAFLVSSALWFFLMIIFWFVLPYMVYRRERTFKDHFKAILGPDSFIIENDKGSRSWQWEQFSTWLETPHFFHLYFSSNSFFIIPKSAFEGDELHEARKILRDKIKK